MEAYEIAENTVAKQLFTTPWMCMVANIHFYSETELQTMGMVSSGDAEMDKAVMLDKRSVYLTIAQMAHLHGQGATIRLMDSSWSIQIYRLIRQHMQNWQKAVETLVNIPKIPVEGLKEFDQFAMSIYPIAARFEIELTPTDTILNHIRGQRRFGRELGTEVVTQNSTLPAQDITQAPQGSDAITDSINRATFGRRRYT